MGTTLLRGVKRLRELKVLLEGWQSLGRQLLNGSMAAVSFFLKLGDILLVILDHVTSKLFVKVASAELLQFVSFRSEPRTTFRPAAKTSTFLATADASVLAFEWSSIRVCPNALTASLPLLPTASLPQGDFRIIALDSVGDEFFFGLRKHCGGNAGYRGECESKEKKIAA